MIIDSSKLFYKKLKKNINKYKKRKKKDFNEHKITKSNYFLKFKNSLLFYLSFNYIKIKLYNHKKI